MACPGSAGSRFLGLLGLLAGEASGRSAGETPRLTLSSPSGNGFEIWFAWRRQRLTTCKLESRRCRSRKQFNHPFFPNWATEITHVWMPRYAMKYTSSTQGQQHVCHAKPRFDNVLRSVAERLAPQCSKDRITVGVNIINVFARQSTPPAPNVDSWTFSNV